MASKFNSEFNYRYLVEGETIWAKIKTLEGFLEGRIRAKGLEEIGNLKLEAKREELKNAEINNFPSWEVKKLQVEVMEAENWLATETDGFRKNEEEIQILNKLLKEAYEIAEPTRIAGYSDEQMWETNQANEYTMKVSKDMQSEIIANGRPSAMTVRQAMCSPETWNALKNIGLIPDDCHLITGSNDPQKIELSLPEIHKTNKESLKCMQN
jgi:hypothetical protein